MTTTDTHYALIATPGMELFAGCPLCEADHALAACPRWHADTGAPLIARLRADREALMEGIGLDPSPECADEYWPGRLRGEGYGLRMCVTAQDATISELREELATLTKAANLAYDAIDWQLECWSAHDDGTPPSDLLNAHAALFGLLHYRQEATNDGDEVPF